MAQFGDQWLRSAMFRERMHLALMVAGGEAKNGTKEQGEAVRREQELVQEEKAMRRREESGERCGIESLHYSYKMRREWEDIVALKARIQIPKARGGEGNEKVWGMRQWGGDYVQNISFQFSPEKNKCSMVLSGFVKLRFLGLNFDDVWNLVLFVLMTNDTV